MKQLIMQHVKSLVFRARLIIISRPLRTILKPLRRQDSRGEQKAREKVELREAMTCLRSG